MWKHEFAGAPDTSSCHEESMLEAEESKIDVMAENLNHVPWFKLHLLERNRIMRFMREDENIRAKMR